MQLKRICPICNCNDGEKLYDFDSPVIKDITLKAKWIKEKPKTDDGPLPATGEDSSLPVWILLTVAACIGITGCTTCRKYKNQ